MDNCTNTNGFGMNEYREGCSQNCNECDYCEVDQPTPKQGDRITINNVPADYHFRDLYLTEGRYEGIITNPETYPGRIGFMTCYTLYLDEGNFQCSGCGNGIDIDKIRFVKTAPANFWKFKNGLPKAHNGETYQMDVNYFECEFTDIKK